jgi:protein-S-isoprenylcysteine O-methyltransferase Ste14
LENQSKSIQIGAFTMSRALRNLLRLILIGIIVALVYLAPPLKNWPLWVSAAGWVGFSIYWGIAAKNSAAAKSSEATRSRRVHELLTNGALLSLFIPVPGLRQRFLPVSSVWVSAGLALQAAGLALALWARRHLGTNWSGRIEIKTDHELVRSGPYRVLRHPIYTALLGMYAGTALIDNQTHALIGLAMVGFAYWRKVRMEEAKLRETFGSGYDDYWRATWGARPGVF